MLFISLLIHDFSKQSGDDVGEPLSCRLGFHKWENYGEERQIFWQEPGFVYGLTTKSKVVFDKRRCLRCGVKLKRIFSTNPDGTLSSVGWAPDTGDNPPKE
jgi:hypothetical protein